MEAVYSSGNLIVDEIANFNLREISSQNPGSIP